MRVILAALLAFAQAVQAAPWVQCAEWHIAANYPTQECKLPAQWCPLISTYDGIAPLQGYPTAASAWTRVTVGNIAEDAKAVFLIGELIITNDTAPAGQPGSYIANMAVFFRAPGAPPSPKPASAYDFACQTAINGLGGERSACSVMVPVIDRQFDFNWYWVPLASPPVHYGFKFYVNAWCR